MDNLNVVVIGYGGMGRYHADGLIEREAKYNKVKVYDIDPEKIEKANKAGFESYASYEEVLADPTVDAVVIVTPNDSHKELSISALKAGKHVVCEKPAMMSVADFDEVIAVAKETNRVFMVHQNRRWDPDFLTIKNLYDNQQLGDLFHLESRVHGANGIPGDWRHKKAQGGGMVLDWGVHLFDQLLYLIDSPLKSVQKSLSYVLGDEVDDGFTVMLHFENGVYALVEVGTSNYLKLPRWYVKGLAGSAVINDWDLHGDMLARKDGDRPSHDNLKPIQAGVGLTKTMAPPSEEATMALALPAPLTHPFSFYENFYDVVNGTAEPFVTNAQVRNVLVLIETILG